MRDHNQVFQLLGETSASIFPLAREIMGPLFEEHFSEQQFYQPVFIAYQLLPGMLTEEIYLKRAPYNNPDAIRENLEGAVKDGYLDKEEVGKYKVSQKGKEVIELVHARFYGHINEVNRFPAEKLKNLSDLLGRLVKAAGKAEFSSGILGYELSHGGHPEVSPGTLAEIDQLLDDLNAFRDDAHIAAWFPTGVSGQVWEALTFIWNGEARTANELAERLPYRSYTEDEYQEALDQLVALEWSDPGDDGYHLTDTGRDVREKAEEETNSYYFKSWSVLTDSDLDTLRELLEGLKDMNQDLVEDDTP